MHWSSERFCYVVNAEEVSAYRESLPHVEIIGIPSGATRDIVSTRNWILSNVEADRILMVDDDLKHIQRILPDAKRSIKRLNVDEIHELCLNGFQMAEDCSSGIWGINPTDSRKCYQQARPLSFSNVVLGPFLGILDKELRFDERITLKEDYDFFLQHLNAHRKVLRFNYFNYIADHQKLPGGCQDYRTEDLERVNFEIFQKKWGSKIVAENFKNKGSINPIIKRPI
jgi:hypothetical protein